MPLLNGRLSVDNYDEFYKNKELSLTTESLGKFIKIIIRSTIKIWDGYTNVAKLPKKHR